MQTRLPTIERLVDSYVSCWSSTPKGSHSIYQDNETDCEQFQLNRNEITPEKLSYEELCMMASLLTRSLRGQINTDHKLYWAWCGELPSHFRDSKSSLLGDREWTNIFKGSIHFLLAKTRPIAFSPDMTPDEFIAASMKQQRDKAKYFNCHFLALESHLQQGIAPLLFALLEGALRRKNGGFIDRSGNAIQEFKVTDSIAGMLSFDPLGKKGKKKITQIGDLLGLFEQKTIAQRNKSCYGLNEIKAEIASHPQGKPDIRNLIDEWRNELMHGTSYWYDKIPIITNLICLLVLDEIGSNDYAVRLPEILKTIRFHVNTNAITGYAEPILYPPDI